ncbi:c-type heme family protein [Nostoc sp. CALU 1950]|uniref:Tll0287-like domain-containing protein n=1 Tax=Nostoc sp. CALU 1950 TaxID=3104321 RepID=UPI003EBF3C4C
MLKNLNLKQKFTILLLVILTFGLSLSGFALSSLLRENAKQDISSTALMLMETMSSVRKYTSTQVNPELADKLATEFLPQSVPAYSAREVFEILRKTKDYREFFYKEATLNPTNLRDKADGFEAEIVERFRNKSDLKEVSGFRSIPVGDIFYIARPLPVSEQSCLVCHSVPEAAPQSMINLYGTANGFGWKLNEIVGAQIISVPANNVINKANQSSLLIILIVSTIFIATILLVNLFLNRQVVMPLKRMTRIAEEVSTGHLEVEFEQMSNDEIGNLAKAFKRMQLSLEMAMKRIKRTQGSTGD